MKHGLTVGYP